MRGHIFECRPNVIPEKVTIQVIRAEPQSRVWRLWDKP